MEKAPIFDARRVALRSARSAMPTAPEEAMIFYPQIKWMHVAAVITSGSLFLLRGLAVQAKARWPMAAPVGCRGTIKAMRRPSSGSEDSLTQPTNQP